MPDPNAFAALAPLIRREMDPATAARELRAVRRRHRRRQVGIGVAATATLALIVGLMTRTDPRPPYLQLADGSRVHALSADLDLRVRSSGATARFELAAGAGRFEVAEGAQLELQIASVRLFASDRARFEARRLADAAEVEVLAGALEFGDTAERVELTGRRRFPLRVAVPGPAGPRLPAPARAPETTAAPPSVAPPTAAPSQVPSAASLSPAPPPTRAASAQTRAAPAPRPAPAISPASLLAAADAARLRGEPQAAIAHLEALVARFPNDPQAATAAFSVGRLQTDPAAAARAFERAVALAPTGPLVIDALTRAALKWQAAGDLARARRLARLVAERAPDARHLRRLGGLLDP